MKEITPRQRLIRALRRQEVDRPPVWLMRQAGRYMPEYRALKEDYDFAAMCRTPDVAAEISLMPYRAFSPDAVIVFNDILIPLESMGREVVYGENGGPRITNPVRVEDDVRSLQVPEFTPAEPVARTIGQLRDHVGYDTAILGFAGAPFTMAAYLTESLMSRDLFRTRRLMYEQPALFDSMLGKIADTVIRYLILQIEAGADAVQLFDTWAGVLPPHEYVKHALPFQKRVIDGVRHLGKPVILFVNGSASVLRHMVDTGADVISVDWRTSMADVYRQFGGQVGLQGNLDPMALFASPDYLRRQVHDLLSQVDPCKGYVFNLGHGILPDTPYENVRLVFREIRELSYAAV